MDLNGDGHLDILSGCYDCLGDVAPEMEQMAGLFHIFYGNESHEFGAVDYLKRDDGKPLIAGSPFLSEEDYDKYDEGPTPEEKQAFYDASLDQFCTRPTAADLNGDGHLDLVVGNAAGTFSLILGRGKGKFASTSEFLKTADGARIRIERTSDPCVVDWDADGDLDIVSGCELGGVFLSTNIGSKTKPRFSAFETLIEPTDWESHHGKMGDEHINGPSEAIRVWVEDLNSDGALDIVVGDNVTVTRVAEGVKESDVKTLLAKWQTKKNKVDADLRPQMEKIFAKMDKLDEAEESEENYKALERLEDELARLDAQREPLLKEKEKIVRETTFGSVWVYYQKQEQQKKQENPAEGQRTIAEFKTYVSEKIPGLDKASLRKIGAAVDKNSDGLISDAEFEGRFEAIQSVMNPGDEADTDGGEHEDKSSVETGESDASKLSTNKNAKAIGGSSFASPVRLNAGGKPISVESPGYASPAIADMNSDGRLDLLVGQYQDGKINVYLRNKDNSFAAGEWLKTGSETAEVPGIW